MNKKMGWLRTKIVNGKIYAQRSLSYVSILNSSMILYLFLSNLNTKGVIGNPAPYFGVIFILAMVGVVTVGWMEDKLGFFRAELETANRRNTQLIDILEKIESIEKKIDNRFLEEDSV